LSIVRLPEGIPTVPLAELVPYARNARTHSPEQVDKIAASMIEFGWTQPVLIGDDNGIIAGHGRVMAAVQLGLSEAPVIRLAHLSPEQRRAYVLADNQLASLGGWDNVMLAGELAALSMTDYDLDILGFPSAQIEALLEGVTADLERTGSTLDEGMFGKQPTPGSDTSAPAQREAKPPSEFREFGEDIETEHQCPKCGYRWSGSSAASDDA
jgi:hypothetical protein